MPQALSPSHGPASHACSLCRGPCTRRRVAPILSKRMYHALLALLALRSKRSSTR